MSGGGGSGGGGGDNGGVNTGHDQNIGPGDIDFSPPGTSTPGPGVDDPDSGDTSTSGGFGSQTAAEAQAAANEAGITGFSANNVDATFGADPSMGMGPFSGISAGPPGTNAAAQAEAAAIGAAIGEMDAYASQVALGPIAQAFNFLPGPFDVNKTHDQYGRGVYGINVNVPSVVGGLIGGPLGGFALGQLGRGLGIDTNLSFSPSTSYSGLGPGGVGTVGVESQGFSMSPGTPSGIESAFSGITSAGLSGPAPDGNDMGTDAGGDTPVFIQPVATPTAVVENVAVPVVVEEAPIDNSLLMRPSTLNTAPANAPADYSLLYPAQERRFQESYALRPGYYSGQLDTTGYQPISSLLI